MSRSGGGLFALAVFALVLLGSCAPFAVQQAPETVARDALPGLPDVWHAVRQASGPVRPGWIAELNDPLLLTLVEEALKNNRDLRRGAARVAQFRALTGQARSALLPGLDYSVGGMDTEPLQGFPMSGYSAGIQFNWELDLWGRLRANQRAAFLSAESALADYRFSQYGLAAAVAQGYFRLIESRLQEAVGRKSYQVLLETDRIVGFQRELGSVSALEVELAHRDLANAAASLVQAESNRRQAVRALEVLLGRYPATGLSGAEQLPAVPPPPPSGLPAALLERRPDIIAAELALAASFGSLEAARAARAPTLSLTGARDGLSGELRSVLDATNAGWRLAANFLGPVFDGGLRRARIEEADAERLATLEDYAQTVLTAFREVEGSLDRSQLLRRREQSLRAAARAANRALALARLRYEEGATDLLDVLTIQSTTFAADSALVAVARERLDEWINLNLALGGGWARP